MCSLVQDTNLNGGWWIELNLDVAILLTHTIDSQILLL